MRVLLAAGANVDASENDGLRPLHCVSDLAAATLLLDAGAAVTLDYDGGYPLAGFRMKEARALLDFRQRLRST